MSVINLRPFLLPPGAAAVTLALALTGGLPPVQAQEEAKGVDDLFFPKEEAAAPAGEAEAAPATLEGLFGAEPAAGDGPKEVPESVEDLFGSAPLAPAAGSAVTGFFQNEIGYAVSGDEHWQKFRNTLQLATKGRFESGWKWHASARLVYDPVFDWDDHYPREVRDDLRDDQRLELTLRETYLDIPAGQWEFRVGRQHIVWGEMVGLFFADVVSAKDMREFILPDFDLLRIPQWAVRAEYFQGDFHGEVVWVPVMTYDDIGEPGGDYFPFDARRLVDPALAAPLALRTEVDAGGRPADSLENSGLGFRFNWLKDGWDTSLFYYTARDSVPAFERRIRTEVDPTLGPVVVAEFERVHERVHQVGATVAKDFGNFVLKGEAIYGVDRPFNVTRVDDRDGLVRLDTLDYVVGLDFNFPQDTNFNAQFFQRYYTKFDDDIAVPATERTDSGFSLYLTTGRLHPKVTPEVIYIKSLNRDDWNLQAKVTWEFEKNWRVVGGADLFDGPDNGVFGRFDEADRVYTELRYTF